MSTETSLSDQEQMTLMTNALHNLGHLLCHIRSITSSGDGPITAETQRHLCQLADALHNVPKIIVQCLIEKTNNAATDDWAQFELKRSIEKSLASIQQHNAISWAPRDESAEGEKPTTPVEVQS